jgi:Ribbon-helix-helix protein, copG family
MGRYLAWENARQQSRLAEKTALKRAAFPESTIVRLPAGTLERVRQAAKHGGTTSAELMRQAIRRVVEKPAPLAPRSTSRGPLAKHLDLPRFGGEVRCSFPKNLLDQATGERW